MPCVAATGRARRATCRRWWSLRWRPSQCPHGRRPPPPPPRPASTRWASASRRSTPPCLCLGRSGEEMKLDHEPRKKVIPQGVPSARGLGLEWLRFGMFHHFAQLLNHFCRNRKSHLPKQKRNRVQNFQDQSQPNQGPRAGWTTCRYSERYVICRFPQPSWSYYIW